MRRVLIAALFFLGVAQAGVAQTLTALSIDFNSEVISLHDLSLATGAASNTRTPGQTGFMVGLAYRPQDGFLYGLCSPSAPGSTFDNQLVRFDPVTGVATAIGNHGLNNVFEGGLAVDPTTGILYGLGQFVNPDIQLFTLDVNTGLATIIGNVTGMTNSLTFNDPSAIAFDASGQLYMLDGFNSGLAAPNADLYQVNKATAAVTSTVTLDRRLSVGFGMAFHPVTGELYLADSNFDFGGFIATNSVYTLDPNTGTTTLIGPMGIPTLLTDITFISAVPEPASLTLVGLGAAAGWRRFKGKGKSKAKKQTARPVAIHKKRIKVRVRIGRFGYTPLAPQPE